MNSRRYKRIMRAGGRRQKYLKERVENGEFSKASLSYIMDELEFLRHALLAMEKIRAMQKEEIY